MPWTCAKCQADDLPDTVSTCPGCGERKLAWTVNEGQTRRFQVTRGVRDKLELLTGDGRPAEEATALPREGAAGRAREGRRPGPEHVLVARLTAKPGADLGLRVSVHYAGQEPREVDVPGPATVTGPGPVDVELVFVHGEGEAPRWEGLHVIDVSEPGACGHAPSVSVAALKKKPQELPVRAWAAATAGPGRLWGWVGYEHLLLDSGLPGVKANPHRLVQGVRHVDVKVLHAPPGLALTPRFTAIDGVFDFGAVPAGEYEVEVSAEGARRVHPLTVPLRDVDEWGAGLDLGPVAPTPLAKNLAAGREVMALVNAELRSVNKLSIETLVNLVTGAALDYPLMVWRSNQAKTNEAEAPEVDQPPLSLTAPGPNYTLIRQIARIAREHAAGNCGEKAAYAAIACAARGVHPVEQFQLQRADHSFCVVGRAPRSSCADPRAWGPEAVIVDPWAEEVYPAVEVNQHLQHFKGKHEGLGAPPTKITAIVKL
ncbi:MAG: carboxypeptidase-like regulatory domain-containing protein [Planctomycetes bacterium]|nr:carboxypeptidase-like regulatory domain-containing protein [Planctomycetota bacterium]